MAKLLLDKGADVNRVDMHGKTLLTNAAGKGHFEMVKLLLDKGADVSWIRVLTSSRGRERR